MMYCVRTHFADTVCKISSRRGPRGSAARANVVRAEGLEPSWAVLNPADFHAVYGFRRPDAALLESSCQVCGLNYPFTLPRSSGA
jgi:hypothetical protein